MTDDCEKKEEKLRVRCLTGGFADGVTFCGEDDGGYRTRTLETGKDARDNDEEGQGKPDFGRLGDHGTR